MERRTSQPSPTAMQNHKDLYLVMGQAIAKWALLEGALVLLATKLIGTSPKKAGLIMYSIININVWLSLINELFLDDPAYSEFTKRWNHISEEIRKLNNARVAIAHGSLDPIEPEEGKMPVLKPFRLDKRKSSSKAKTMSAGGRTNFY